MGYVSLVIGLPLILMIWLLILWNSYCYLLILILVRLLFQQSYLKLYIKMSWQVTPSKVRRVMQTLDMKKAVSSDGVSPYIFNYWCDELYFPVCSPFQNVCRAGELPSSWKVSCVTPVYGHKCSTADP